MTGGTTKAAPGTGADTRTATREKQAVALHSLLAAVALTGSKLVVGLSTGSLGILSEAAHSGLDLVATVLTFWAIRIAGRPPDSRHTYGHGKFENLSALAQTLLLLITCIWIVVEGLDRLLSASPVHVRADVWSFLVILTSISVDIWRSRALRRAAVKHASQALEADALHFSTDIWSSSVVLAGLIGVVLAGRWEMPWLLKADAVAALGVAAIVVLVSVRMGRKSLDDLLDAVPEGLADQVARAARVDGVLDVRHVRVRRSGPRTFADICLTVDPLEGIERAHEIASAVESAARRVLPRSDVTIHVEPESSDEAPVATAVHRLAARRGLAPHDVRVYEEEKERVVELHLEMDGNLSLGEAHEQASAFEKALHDSVPRLRRVITHIEPSGSRATAQPASREDTEPVLQALRELPEATGLDCEVYGVQVYKVADMLTVGLCCALDRRTSLGDAHEVSTHIEQFLRARLPHVSRVVVHVEPSEK